MKKIFKPLLFVAVIMVLAVIFIPQSYSFAQTIIDEWNTVKVPLAPELKPVTIDPQTTALLLLDFNKQTCNPERRPRCIASIPKVKKLLEDARTKGVVVIYSLSAGAVAADIAKELAPGKNEPVVTSGPDKFLGTELEKILKDKNISSVIVTGTAAHGAVLHTSSTAAFKGFSVIVPVDGLSAEALYAEQYTVWHLINAPRVSTKATITRTDLIKY